MHPYSIYLHVPFCRHRCGYCDFNTYAGLDTLIPDYVRALCQEIEIVASSAGERLPAHTIFFGGGTPSLLPVEAIAHILRVLETCFQFQSGMEITLEANPGTVSLESLRDMRACGINRLSLGVQSSNPGELQLLERQHDFFDVIRSVGWSRQAGFENINLDLIYGLPYQTLKSWLITLDRSLDLSPDHLSLYALTVEHGTPMKYWVERGLLDEPDPDIAADMYEASSGILADAGYVQYEISNWARQTMGGEVVACRHNLQYWRNQPYLGLGAGAHGYANKLRVANVLSPSAYIDRVTKYDPKDKLEFPQSPSTAEVLPIDQQTEMAELMIMGMRLVSEGVSAEAFALRFNVGLEEVYGEEIERLLRWGLVEWSGDNANILRLTEGGRLLGNRVFREFL